MLTTLESPLSVFSFESQEIRFVHDPEGVFDFGIIAEDLAVILEASSGKDFARSVDAEWVGAHTMHTNAGNRTMTVLWEPGIYHALAVSRKEKAKPFQKWVFGEVIPSIRKTGTYFDPATLSRKAILKMALEAEEKLEEAQSHIKLLAASNEILEVQADFYADKLEEAEDTLEVYRAITSDQVTLSFKQVADALNIKKLGRNNLVKYLKSKSFLVQNGTAPMRAHIEAEHAISITTSWFTPKGVANTSQTSHFTFKGLSWLIKNLLADGYDVQTTAAQIWDSYNAVPEEVLDLAETAEASHLPEGK